MNKHRTIGNRQGRLPGVGGLFFAKIYQLKKLKGERNER